MKIVINRCYGGFGLSDMAFEKLLNRKGILFEIEDRNGSNHYYDAGHLGDGKHFLYDREFVSDRSDADLVAVVEELGKESNAYCALLAIANVPDDVDWYIEEHDGMEWVAETHRTWTEIGQVGD